MAKKVNIRGGFKAEMAKLRMGVMSGWAPVSEVPIPDIPLELSLFPGTKNHYWQNVEFPNERNTSACIYELPPGEIFAPHFHKNSGEQVTMLTPGAEIEVVTYDSIRFFKFPESFYFEKGEVHAVKNVGSITLSILVIWHPKMVGGFDVNFVNDDSDE